MTTSPLLLPVFAMVLLSFIVWLAMFLARVKSMKADDIDIEEFTSHKIHQRLSERANIASEHWINILEMPVLFYTLIVLLIATEVNSVIYCQLAWVFVGFRYAHSLVALTYNKVLHRFITYLLSSIALWLAWALFAKDILV